MDFLRRERSYRQSTGHPKKVGPGGRSSLSGCELSPFSQTNAGTVKKISLRRLTRDGLQRTLTLPSITMPSRAEI